MGAEALAAIQVRDLGKRFRVPEREAGLGAALRGLVHRRTREVRAVDGLDFSIAAGEIVGFLGPNGAGKTTTIKMLAGLIQPSRGEARVLGFRPGRRDRAYLRQMALIMGNRNQLGWDLPALDSFALNRAIYAIPPAEFEATRDALIALLELGDLVRKPVRNLSLGERMKVEIAASLLHRPQVLFLDEPTIGLDLSMQRRIRRFIRDYNQAFGATVLLTSHYMADVEALCERVIVIDHGRLLFDGRLDALASRYADQKRLRVTLVEGARVSRERLAEFGEPLELEAGRFTLGLPREAVARITARLLTELPVADLSIAEVSIEDVIQRVFESEPQAASDG